jgi:hypothetical protein
MTEADADDTDTILLQQLLCKLHKLQDPWVVVERVVFFRVLISVVLKDDKRTCNTYLTQKSTPHLCPPSPDTPVQ